MCSLAFHVQDLSIIFQHAVEEFTDEVADNEDHYCHRRSFSELEVLEGFLVDSDTDYVRHVARAACGQQLHDRVVLEPPDYIQNYGCRENRSDGRQDDAEEELPGARTIYLCRFNDILGYRLQSREDIDHDQRISFPDADENDDGECPFFIAQPGDLLVNDSHIYQSIIEQSIQRVYDPLEDKCNDDIREQPGQNQNRSKDLDAGFALIQDQAENRSQDEMSEDHEHRELQGGEDASLEFILGEDRQEILQANEIPLLREICVEEADDNTVDQRVNNQCKEHNEYRKDEEVRRQLLLIEPGSLKRLFILTLHTYHSPIE